MASPLSLSQSSFLLASLVSNPPHRLDSRPLLSFRPLVLSPPIETGTATISIGSTSITSQVSSQVIKSSSTEEDFQQDDEDDRDEDDSAGVWTVSIGTSPSCQPPVLNGGRNSKSGCLELDASLLQLERMLKRHLNQVIPIEQFIILSSPNTASSSASSSFSSSSGPCSSSASNREKLRGATYWSLSLDITITSLAGGNMYDSIWSAAYAAVYRTRIPRTREVAYIPTESSRDRVMEGSADMEKMGIKSLKGEKAGRTAAGAAGKAVDFELVDVWDQGSLLTGREKLGVGLTVGLLPNDTHLLDPSQEEELSLPTSRRVFLVVPPSTPSQVQMVHLLPSLLNLTAGETDAPSEEDSLRFSRPSNTRPDVSSNGESGQQWEQQGWGLPTMQRVRMGMQLGSKYAAELGQVLRDRLDAEDSDATDKKGDAALGMDLS